MQHAQTLSAFKSQLDTHLFSVSYSEHFQLSPAASSKSVCASMGVRTCVCVMGWGQWNDGTSVDSIVCVFNVSF